MARSRISVRLDQDIQRRLDVEVKSSGKSASELVREALTAYFRTRPVAESSLELARRHRLIGCGKRLPSELSTNRKHLEGFGR